MPAEDPRPAAATSFSTPHSTAGCSSPLQKSPNSSPPAAILATISSSNISSTPAVELLFSSERPSSRAPLQPAAQPTPLPSPSFSLLSAILADTIVPYAQLPSHSILAEDPRSAAATSFSTPQSTAGCSSPPQKSPNNSPPATIPATTSSSNIYSTLAVELLFSSKRPSSRAPLQPAA
ncbi:uncharacterized protein LOC131155884 [Malania oleifera]|uniref:uncharacterized protein LOC131155884 n=1 Tax=Malania oleifera TaxID=397392 RepID=UPI0025ADBEA7|nr:uncharacterized protein LOC131155884 [Malania oleifera]